MVYVYAVIDTPPDAIGGITGIDDQPLSVRDRDGVGIVFGDCPGGTPRPTRNNAWRHEQVAEQLMARHALLPARFGTVLADADAVAESLARNHGALVEGLRRVRGCVELGVRVMWAEGAIPGAAVPAAPPIDTPGASGRAFLAARLEQEQRRRERVRRAAELAGALDESFRAVAADGTFRVLPSAMFVMTGAYLVPRGSTDEFRRRVEEAGAAHPDARLLCTGPWAPYHFVPAVTTSEVQCV